MTNEIHHTSFRTFGGIDASTFARICQVGVRFSFFIQSNVFVTSRFSIWFISVVVLAAVFKSYMFFCPKFCASCGATPAESDANLCRESGSSRQQTAPYSNNYSSAHDLEYKYTTVPLDLPSGLRHGLPVVPSQFMERSRLCTKGCRSRQSMYSNTHPFFYISHILITFPSIHRKAQTMPFH